MRLNRLALGDWLNATGSLGLLVVLFAAPWYRHQASLASGLGHGSSGASAALGQHSATGWETFGVLGPLAVVVAAIGLIVWSLYGTRRSPVLPMAINVLQSPLSVALALSLLVRVLFDPPVLGAGTGGASASGTLYGAYLGLACSLVILIGVHLSFRHDGVPAADQPREIETIDLTGTRTGGHA